MYSMKMKAREVAVFVEKLLNIVSYYEIDPMGD